MRAKRPLWWKLRGRLHLARKFPTADRLRVVDCRREVPQQRVLKRVEIGVLDAVSDMPLTEIPNRRQDLAGQM